MKDSWMETTAWGPGEQKKGYSGLRGKTWIQDMIENHF